MEFNKILDYFEIDKRTMKSDSVQAKCPAHADKKASLTITHKGDKTFLYCHAGCKTEDILDRAGLKMTDLFDNSLEKNNNSRDNIEAIYEFFDENGVKRYEKVRLKGKKFLHRRNYEGKIIWGLNEGVYTETYPGSKEYSMKERKGANSIWLPQEHYLLYNLPNVIKGVKENKTIYIVEGEKDADSLIKRGLIATTTSKGASKGNLGKKWDKEFNKYFEGANVVLIPDNDSPGKAFMEHVAGEIKNIAKKVKILTLTGIEPKGDVTDWLETGHDIYDLQELAKNTIKYTPFKGDIIYGYNWSDDGNAKRFVAMYGDDIKFNPKDSKWYIWNTRYWEKDLSYKIVNLYRNVLGKLQEETYKIDLGDFEKTEKAKSKVQGFIDKSESASKIKGVIELTATCEGQSFLESDTNDMLFNAPNVTIDLNTFEEREHRREDLITNISSVKSNPKAKCPNWIAFLEKIFMNDYEIINYVQRAVGYSLTGLNSEQRLFVMLGGGANGKSTFVKVLRELMGTYVDTLNSDSLMETKSSNPDAPRSDLAALVNKRVIITSELQEGQVFHENLIKGLTGEDYIKVRFLHKNSFEMKNKAKIWMMSNERPIIKGKTEGIWRRFHMIPFKYSLKENERNKFFYEEKLEPELEGILWWALIGFKKWKEEGLNPPAEVKKAVEEYKADMDQLGRFIEDDCTIHVDAKTLGKDLYRAYIDWCIDNGENYRMSNHKFTKELKAKGYINKRGNRGSIWEGIRPKL